MDTVVAGFATGLVQTVIGHPFDTMKVWKQSGQSIIVCPKALYRGFAYRLVTGSCLASIQFSTAAFARSHMIGTTAITHDPCIEFIAGSFSGIFVGLAISPVDRYKIMAQTRGMKPQFGVMSCLLREIPASGVYFGMYAQARSSEIPILGAGAVAGVSSWIMTYPLDMIKTQIQSGGTRNIYTGFQQIQAGKLPAFRGLSFSLVRATMVNSIGFWIYDKFSQ